MKKVLVTGGTGFLGSNIAESLIEQGYNVRILRRKNSTLSNIRMLDAEHAIGDVRDIDAVQKAIQGCDTVFHTAAMISYWKKQRSEMFSINIDGTKNVVEACLNHNIERLIHTSSIAAIGEAKNGMLTRESDLLDLSSETIGYKISKHHSEKLIYDGISRGLDAVILYPSIIIGPGDIHFHGGQIIRDVFKGRFFYYPTGGTNIVYVKDVVKGHISAAKRGKRGERYILSGENLTYKEILSTVADIVGAKHPFLKMPKAVIQILATIIESGADVLGKKPWITKELVERIGKRRWYSSEKAIKELGYSFLPFRDSVGLTFEWYRRNNYL